VPVLGIEGNDVLDSIQVSLRENPAVLDCDRRIANADGIDFPQLRRPFFRPFFQQPLVATDAIPIRPAPLRPVSIAGRNLAKGDSRKQEKT